MTTPLTPLTRQILTQPNVIVQGITGTSGRSHTATMLAYGTRIVAGTSPNQSVTEVSGVPVYPTIAKIQQHVVIDITVIFVPAAHAKAAIIEAIEAHIPLIICISEGVPIHDMLQIKQLLAKSSSVLIGPNCPGVLVPGVHNIGIIPAALATSGSTAIVSRSGTLTYEAMDLLTKAGFGQCYIIGIGGDMVRGCGFIECLDFFENDPLVERIVLIGEIGGTSEISAADYIKQHLSKPVYAYIAGHNAPSGIQMGHAGAILGNNERESAASKTEYLQECGATVARSISELIALIS